MLPQTKAAAKDVEKAKQRVEKEKQQYRRKNPMNLWPELKGTGRGI